MAQLDRGRVSPNRGVGNRARALALVLATLLVPFAVPIAYVMFAITTFLFHFSGGQYRMGPIVTAGPFIAIAAALVAGSITAWRTAQFGLAFGVMARATGIAWAVLVLGYWLLSFAFGATPISPGPR
jgi:hypothetical protein